MERVQLFLEDSGQELHAAADAGMTEEERARAGHGLSLALPALAPVVERRVPMVYDVDPPRELARFDDVRAVLLLPLISRDAIIGAAALFSSREDHPFDAERVDFLQDVAQQIAFGLENARLFGALSRLASTDELTGLANRRRFLELAEAEMSGATDEPPTLGLVLVDIDQLARINDDHGYSAGDEAIVHAARALGIGRSKGEVAARLAGEEFALLLPGHTADAAMGRATAARTVLSNGFVAGVGPVTASFGVATAPRDGHTPAELLKIADERLHRAQERGGNRVCGPEKE